MESPHHLKDESQNGGVFESSSFFTDDAKVRFFLFSFFFVRSLLYLFLISKVEFYTGIQGVEKLWFLFRYLEDRMNEEEERPTQDESNDELPLFEQLCVTLMHLRLNLHPRDLAYRFNLNEVKVSMCIERFILAVSKFLIPTHIQWQKRIDIQTSLPKCFPSNVRKCICIVEIFRINLDYHYSLKYLVAFSPLGLVSYFSPTPFPSTWDDLQIWRESAILEQFAQGDQILKLNSGKLTLYQADFFKSVQNFQGIQNKRVQLHEVKLTGEVQAGLQAHAERVLDNFIRRFAILSKGPTISFNKSNDRFSQSYKKVGKIIEVCCALHNTNPMDF